ncbi:MAG: hypothetical protein Mars2KO_39770 [Maribacter sp.]
MVHDLCNTNENPKIVKFQNPFFFCLILAATLFLYKKEEHSTPKTTKTIAKDFKLVVERGAFHYDRFELTATSLTYYPEKDAQHPLEKYNLQSKVTLNREKIQQFIEHIDNKGFWNLKNHYTTPGSCTSQVKVTLTMNGKTKTVVCDDFERGCSELIHYIDKKVIEWEGNDLKRIYLPG